jgi:hypothetical protein
MARNLFGDNAFDNRRTGFILGGGGNSQEEEDPLLTAIRKQGLFQRPGVQPMNSSSITQPEAEARVDPVAQYLQRMKGGQATTAYREHLNQMPTREAYAPSQTRRIGGALAAAAGAFNNPKMGAEIGEQIIGAPYRNALESWQMKGAGLSEQADMEQKDIKGQIEYIKRIQDQQQAERDYGLKERSTAADELRAQTDVARQQAQEDNYRRQGWNFYDDANGMRVGDNTTTGEHKVFGPSLAGRTQADRERGTNIQAYSAETGRGQLGVSQANLGMRGDEFAHRVQQDEVLNQDRATGRSLQQQGVDIQRQNAGSAGYINAGEVFTANAMAAQEVARTDSRFQGWSLNEQGMPVKPGSLWGTNPVDPTSQDAKEFLNAVEEKKKNILSSRRPGVGNVPTRAQQPNLGGMGGGPIKFSDLPPGGGGLKF